MHTQKARSKAVAQSVAKPETGHSLTLGGRVRKLFGAAGTIRRQKAIFVVSTFVPMITLFIIIRVIPIGWVLSLAFTNFNLRRPKLFRFMGFENFARLLKDPVFSISFKNTMEFVLISVPVVLILGLVFALLINRKLKLEGLYQTLFFLPFILSSVPATIIWKWIYAPGKWGLANYLLESIGLDRVGWLTDPQIALLEVIVVYVWKNVGYYVVIFLVGLKNIPEEIREAAMVDGATRWQAIRYVDLPLIRSVMLFALVMATIAAFAVFTIVYVMSQGTDASAGVEISVLAMQMYQEGFTYSNMGYASAIAAILFVISCLAVIVQFRFFGREQ